MKSYSVITATLNSEGSLQRTIDSVLSQSPPPCEYIFVDGGSKDKTLDIIASIDFASHGVKLTIESGVTGDPCEIRMMLVNLQIVEDTNMNRDEAQLAMRNIAHRHAEHSLLPQLVCIAKKIMRQ